MDTNTIVDYEYNKLIHMLQLSNNNINDPKYTDEYSKFTCICNDGLFYGYPLCCILYYYHNYSFDTLKLNCDEICLKASNDTGFIPCLIHSEEIINGDVNINDLIDYNIRSSKYDFPNDKDNRVLVHYIDHYQTYIDKCYNIYMKY